MRSKQRNSASIGVWIFWIVFGLFAVGVAVWPVAQNYMLAHKQNEIVAKYDKTDRKLSNSRYLEMFYRQKRAPSKDDPFATGAKKSKTSTKHSVDAAKATLNPIATLSIPRIREVLPVYGNTDDDALDNGIGLMNNTGDLLGGRGKHPALAGHRGLSIARLFTDLPKVKLKDKFFIRVNGNIHAYQVDQIKTVKPQDLRDLAPDPQKDYVTLITCTPLFANTHRLLVRGHRIPYVPKDDTGETGGLTALGLLVIVISGVIALLLTLWGIYRYREKHRVYTY